jgi:hypothetical protein
MEQKKFEFKKLELPKQERGWLERTFFSKAMLFVVVGAILTSTYYYFTEWQNYSVITYKLKFRTHPKPLISVTHP